MDAPIKLYFTENEAALDIYSKKCTSLDIEYTRTDAFIEKAAEWMEHNVVDYLSDTGVGIVFDKWNGIEEFKKAMELWNK